MLLSCYSYLNYDFFVLVYTRRPEHAFILAAYLLFHTVIILKVEVIE